MATIALGAAQVFSGGDIELHLAPEGLALTRGGKVGPDENYQLADYEEIESVEVKRRAGRALLVISFASDRPQWEVPSMPAHQAEWARDLLQGSADTAHRGRIPEFAQPLARERIPEVIARTLQRGEHTVAEVLDLLLVQALHYGASDIHLESLRDAVRVSFRLDGLLVEIASLPRSTRSRLFTRLKVIAGAAVYRRDIPQEGRSTAHLLDRDVDLRISILPTIHGEKATIRLFDPDTGRRTLDRLGMDPDQLKRLQNVLLQPQGTILVTGPSGSGKTTTLYAGLVYRRDVAPTRPSIATVEDPVEYDLGDMNQTQINPGVDLTFAHGLRTVLRQDPDVIMVGEIRDPETAQIAVQAGLTGHLILSTVHAPNAAGVFARLLDLGVEPYVVASSVSAVVSQRLVRQVCRQCSVEETAAPEKLAECGFDAALFASTQVRAARGCEACRQTGYAGRTGIFELLAVDERLRELVMAKLPAADLERRVEELGGGLRAAAQQKVLAGVTTLDEVIRVLGSAEQEAGGND